MKTKPNQFKRFLFAKGTCPICQTGKLTHYSDYPSDVAPFNQKQVHYCTRCGSGHVPDSAKLLHRYYDADYAIENRKDRDVEPEIYFSPEHRKSNRNVDQYFLRAESQIALLRKHGATFGSVLDFGSGPGYFLRASKTPRPYAFEPDEASSKYLDYLQAFRYESVKGLPKGRFDVVMASHTIEHLIPEDLHHTLVRLMQSLKPGGRMYIEVPNGGHTYLDLEGARQEPHTLFFTPQGLSEAMANALKDSGGKILFQEAVAQPEIPELESPIYQPPPDPYFSANRGRLTLICAAPGAEQRPGRTNAQVVAKRFPPKPQPNDDAVMMAFDRLFTKWLVENPNGRWVDFMAWYQLRHLSTGDAHATLGSNLESGQEFRTAGEGTMKTLLNAVERATGKRELGADWTVCDYGCGTLRLGYQLMNTLKPRHYIGLDLVPDLIDMGVEMCGDLIAEKQPVLSTFDDFADKLADNPCDLVCAFNVHCHVHPTDQREFAHRINTLCRKPGSLFVAQVMVYAEPARYQRSGWAWPTAYYENFLQPMTLVDQKVGISVRKGTRNIASHILTYQNLGTNS